jgi:hypothetical protein
MKQIAASFATATAVGLATLAVTHPAHAQSVDDDADSVSFPQVDRKIRNLRKRVRELEGEVAALQTRHLPVEASVNCSAGGTISQVLADHADAEGKLTILLTGTCTEAVRISRSDVSLQGQGAGTTLQAPAGALFTLMVDNGSDNVSLNGLTVTGLSTTTAAVLATKGAHVLVRSAVIQGTISGVMALDNGTLDVADSIIRNNSQGIYAGRGGVVSVSGGAVESNTIGALAWKAGTVLFTSSQPDLSLPAGSGPVIRNNTSGAVVRSGGFAEFADTVVQNNTNGVVVDSGGAVQLFQALNGSGNQIVANTNVGIVAYRNSSIVVSDLTNVISGNRQGIVCVGNPSYIVPVGFSVTGNQVADIVGCVP